jgi:hypothetical protein
MGRLFPNGTCPCVTFHIAETFKSLLCYVDIKCQNQVKLESHSCSMERTTRRPGVHIMNKPHLPPERGESPALAGGAPLSNIDAIWCRMYFFLSKLGYHIWIAGRCTCAMYLR